jgi:hypothetical protein
VSFHGPDSLEEKTSSTVKRLYINDNCNLEGMRTDLSAFCLCTTIGFPACVEGAEISGVWGVATKKLSGLSKVT